MEIAFVVVLMVIGAAFEVAFGSIGYAIVELCVACLAVVIGAATRMDFARARASARRFKARRSL